MTSTEILKVIEERMKMTTTSEGIYGADRVQYFRWVDKDTFDRTLSSLKVAAEMLAAISKVVPESKHTTEVERTIVSGAKRTLDQIASILKTEGV